MKVEVKVINVDVERRVHVGSEGERKGVRKKLKKKYKNY